jgi:hypothetical protein
MTAAATVKTIDAVSMDAAKVVQKIAEIIRTDATNGERTIDDTNPDTEHTSNVTTMIPTWARNMGLLPE